jgi:hypothetical protein
MLGNYAQRAQFAKKAVHIIHKKSGKEINRTLKSSWNDRILCRLGSNALPPHNRIVNGYRSIFPKPMIGMIDVIPAHAATRHNHERVLTDSCSKFILGMVTFWIYRRPNAVTNSHC